MVSWIQAGSPASIQYGYVTSNGMVKGEALELTRNTSGRYHDLAVAPGSNGTAYVMALFTETQTELREFVVNPTQRNAVNDVDGDGFNDLLELIIIDADPLDGVMTLADVSPTSDFDGDGLADFDEFYLGFDPTDPTSHLVINSITHSNHAEVSFFAASNLTYFLERSGHLRNPTVWSNVIDAAGTGNLLLTDTNTPNERIYYRLRVPIPPPSP
ncbi:MAG: hypothetical protein AAF492_09920 [Verrucomicrobiota bacterium]